MDNRHNPFYPRFWEDRFEVMKKRYWHLAHGQMKPQKKLGIFTCDMSDLFGIGVPEEWTKLVLEAIRINAFDRFYLLTKQPQNLPRWSPFPENCWVGVTATDYQMFADACEILHSIKAKGKYISFEPLLNLEWTGPNLTFWLVEGGIDWVIIGAQTKPYKPPKIEWVEEIVRACDKAGIPVFLKDNLDNLLNPNEAIDCYSIHPDSGGYRIRQEMPV